MTSMVWPFICSVLSLQVRQTKQVAIIAAYISLSYLLSSFGERGFFILPILFVALLVFYDTRPDLAQGIFPNLWREKK